MNTNDVVMAIQAVFDLAESVFLIWAPIHLFGWVVGLLVSSLLTSVHEIAIHGRKAN